MHIYAKIAVPLLFWVTPASTRAFHFPLCAISRRPYLLSPILSDPGQWLTRRFYRCLQWKKPTSCIRIPA